MRKIIMLLLLVSCAISVTAQKNELVTKGDNFVLCSSSSLRDTFWEKFFPTYKKPLSDTEIVDSAFNCYKKAADAGNYEALVKLGVLWWMKCSYNNVNARVYFENAIRISKQRQLNQRETHCLGFAYYGLAICEAKDESTISNVGMEYLKMASDLECEFAQINYARSTNVPKPEKIRILEKIVDNDKCFYTAKDALYLLGVIAYNDKEYDKAYRYFKKNDEKYGHERAQMICSYWDGSKKNRNYVARHISFRYVDGLSNTYNSARNLIIYM